ncbi:hypothetical protein [Shumkonia mesophila]|uniref:hypothetical protein n=1 Tax=Shumkonia mesophila TaxID=2838854 RepID=UPI00293513AB|nr:hypothetical protein [Shumkonia mesophila]
MTKSIKAPPVAPAKPGRPPRGAVNPALTAQTRKVMGKHYAAKYGVRKERGRG